MQWWKRLNPKQRRLVIAGGAGVALALVALLARRQQPAAPATDPQQQADGAPAGVNPYAGADPSSTFGDNGAALSQLSSGISDQIGQMVTGLGDFESQQMEAIGKNTAAATAAAAAAKAAADAAGKAAASRPPGQPKRRHPSKLLKDARRRDTDPRKPGLQLDPRDTNPNRPGLQRNKRDKDPTRPGIQKHRRQRTHAKH